MNFSASCWASFRKCTECVWKWLSAQRAEMYAFGWWLFTSPLLFLLPLILWAHVYVKTPTWGKSGFVGRGIQKKRHWVLISSQKLLSKSLGCFVWALGCKNNLQVNLVSRLACPATGFCAVMAANRPQGKRVSWSLCFGSDPCYFVGSLPRTPVSSFLCSHHENNLMILTWHLVLLFLEY